MSAIAIVGAFFIGLILGAARAYRVPVVSQAAAVYVEIIRNTPILVQIFFLFFALPQLGIVLEPFTVAWLAVTIWGGAFNTENFRAGFEAVPGRFHEAGFALGFGRLTTFLNVMLPIGGRIALPSSINTYISVLKNTSLMYVIAYPELTTTALKINALTLQTIETFTMLGRHVPHDRVDDVRLDPRGRAASRSARGRSMSLLPDWAEPVLRLHAQGGAPRHLADRRDLRSSAARSSGSRSGPC